MEQGPRILVVDDQESMRMLLCSALRALGHKRLVVAANGAEALHLLRGAPADLVMMDVEMPVMTGLEALRTMRAEAELARIPVVMVTARADAAFVQAVRALNVSGYLLKPVTGAALKASIDRILIAPPAPQS